MNTATIEVKGAFPPGEGKKRGVVKTTDDQMFLVYPEKVGLFHPGRRYEVEYKESQFNGHTYRTITKCTPQQAQQPATNGANGTSHSNSEEIGFVTHMLAAAVQGGAVDFTEADMSRAVLILRDVWRKSFGAER